MIYILIHFEPERSGLIGETLNQLMLGWKEIRLDLGEPLPELKPNDGVVLMGGPMSVNNEKEVPFLTRELTWIETAISRGNSILGVCLGAQLIAKASGARVYPMEKLELGWEKVVWNSAAQADPLMGGAAGEWTPFHWHGETFDLPFGAQLWASSKVCQNQAFKLNSRVIGFQFHIEMTSQIINLLLKTREAQSDLKKAGLAPVDVLESHHAFLKILREPAGTFFQRFWQS